MTSTTEKSQLAACAPDTLHVFPIFFLLFFAVLDEKPNGLELFGEDILSPEIGSYSFHRTVRPAGSLFRRSGIYQVAFPCSRNGFRKGRI